MARRPSHPVLMTLWVFTWIGLPAAFFVPQLWVFEFLGAPIFALATLVATNPAPDVEVELRRGWRPVYFGLLGLLAIAGLAGMVAAAGEARFANAPMGILFLLAFVTAWRAIARPTPRRAAVPAAVLLATWVPLVLVDVVSDTPMAAWQDTLLVFAGITILAASAIASTISLVAFDEHRPTHVPAATARA